MSKHYKQSKVGRGIDLYINDNDYISVGKNGNDITIKCDDYLLSFDNFKDMIHHFKQGCLVKSKNLDGTKKCYFNKNL